MKDIAVATALLAIGWLTLPASTFAIVAGGGAFVAITIALLRHAR
ncbi:hypothetical protein [Corynebacterium hindlerae]|nr:hypothetical protein [Corynebacterium hindlerae]